MNESWFTAPTERRFEFNPVAYQVRILFGQSVITFLFPVILSLAIAWLLRDMAPRRTLYAWVGIVLLYSGARYALVWTYRRAAIAADDWSKWLDVFIGGVFVSGVIWGCAPIALIPHDPARLIEFTLYSGLTLLIICAMVAGAAISYSVSKWVIFFYAFPALVPPAFYLISLGDKYNSALGGFVMLYFVFVLFAAYRMNLQLNRYIRIEHDYSLLQQQLGQMEAQLEQARPLMKHPDWRQNPARGLSRPRTS